MGREDGHSDDGTRAKLSAVLGFVLEHWSTFAPGWRNWQRARLRIPKSSISERRFAFQKTIDLREKDAIFHDRRRVYDRRVKTS